MLTDNHQQRIDTLVALAIRFSASVEEPIVLRALPPLSEVDAQAASLRLRAVLHLSPAEQSWWRQAALAQPPQEMRERLCRAAEVLHTSHVVAALREESRGVLRLLRPQLPPTIIAAIAETGDTYDAPAHAADEKIAALVRRRFLARFVFADALRDLTDLDLLTGVELARFIRVLGVREAALACRGVANTEAVACFVRRFAPEDTRMVTAYLRAPVAADAARLRAAETIVRRALEATTETGALLDRVGGRLLAMAMARRAGSAARLTWQKIPVAGARWLAELSASLAAQRAEQWLINQVVPDLEALAARWRRSAQTLPL